MIINEQDLVMLSSILQEYNRIQELLTYEEVLLDKKLLLSLQRKKQSLEILAQKYNEYEELSTTLAEINDILSQSSREDRKIFEEEKLLTEKSINEIECELKRLIIKHNATMQSIIVEMVGGKGLDDLMNIISEGYINFCRNNAFDVVIESDDSGVKLFISGPNVGDIFEQEKGVHLFIKTSNEYMFKVFVYNRLDTEVFNEVDVAIETCRSSGAGGQHINTTDSAIKAIHLKTGISVICQDERSQIQNKRTAIERLKLKVDSYYENERKGLIEKSKKEQLRCIRKKNYIKTYDVDSNKIIKASGEVITLSDFADGNVL